MGLELVERVRIVLSLKSFIERFDVILLTVQCLL